MGNSSIARYNSFQFKHPRFKTAQFKDDISREIIQTRISLTEKQYDEWVQEQNTSLAFIHQYALFPASFRFQKSGMCGSTGNATVEYENYPYILTEQIAIRKQAEYRVFEEAQMWYLLYTIADVGRKFHSLGSKVGDIRPMNIFINDEGQFKLGTKYSWPGELDNYQKAFYHREKTYLAPEELKDLQIRRGQTQAQFDTAESFTTGLTLLDAALLQSSANMYQRNAMFDESILEGQIENLKNDGYYGDLLKYTIIALLQKDPKKRITLSELSDWLEPHSQEIINLEIFFTINIPQKIHKIASENPINKHNQNPIIPQTQEHKRIVQTSDERETINEDPIIPNLKNQKEKQKQIREILKTNPCSSVPQQRRQIIINGQPIEPTSPQINQSVPMRHTSPIPHLPTPSSPQHNFRYSFNPTLHEQQHPLPQPAPTKVETPLTPECKNIPSSHTITPSQRNEKLQLKNNQKKQIFLRKRSSLKLIEEKIANSRKMFPPI